MRTHRFLIFMLLIGFSNVANEVCTVVGESNESLKTRMENGICIIEEPNFTRVDLLHCESLFQDIKIIFKHNRSTNDSALKDSPCEVIRISK